MMWAGMLWVRAARARAWAWFPGREASVKGWYGVFEVYETIGVRIENKEEGDSIYFIAPTKVVERQADLPRRKRYEQGVRMVQRHLSRTIDLSQMKRNVEQ